VIGQFHGNQFPCYFSSKLNIVSLVALIGLCGASCSRRATDDQTNGQPIHIEVSIKEFVNKDQLTLKRAPLKSIIPYQVLARYSTTALTNGSPSEVFTMHVDGVIPKEGQPIPKPSPEKPAMITLQQLLPNTNQYTVWVYMFQVPQLYVSGAVVNAEIRLGPSTMVTNVFLPHGKSISVEFAKGTGFKANYKSNP
jgi:hypothetical protein